MSEATADRELLLTTEEQAEREELAERIVQAIFMDRSNY